MNIKQMQSAIKRFRAADLSVIKDEKLRAKAQKLQAKQDGFTLLELLVVITLVATLATAALVAYEGIGENAQAAASSSNTLSAENAIRNYRAVEGEYPNQWDNLANRDGTLPGTTGVEPLLADATETFLGQWVTTLPAAFSGTTVLEAAAASLEAVGIDELQTLEEILTVNTQFTPPNLVWNESSAKTAGAASELEFVFAAGALSDVEWNGASQLGLPIGLSIVPSAGNGDGCTADGANISNNIGGTATTQSQVLNLINDALDDDGCHLVLALGFGKDVPGTTIDSRVAISQAPTAVTENVNPATDYARYIALFQVATTDPGASDATADAIAVGDVLPRARLIGVVDAEGRILDQAIAAANQES